MAGDGFTDDADPRAHYPTSEKRGCDAIQGSCVDYEEDHNIHDSGEEGDREEDSRLEVDREEDSRQEVDREEDSRQEVDREEVDGEEDHRIRGSGEEAGCRLELVAEGRVAPV